jgi:hypothetical protein
MNNTMKSVACSLLALGAAVNTAQADVVYTWRTLSATLNGLPTNLTAQGEITLTDAGFSRGSGGVTSFLTFPGVAQTLDGIASARFEMFGGPFYTTAPDHDIINFTASVAGQNLFVDPLNQAGGEGFFVNTDGTDAYWGTPGAGGLTVSYRTDNSFSPCFGPQTLPGSHCVVTGVFERVPEPGTLPILLAAFGILILTTGPATFRRRSSR